MYTAELTIRLQCNTYTTEYLLYFDNEPIYNIPREYLLPILDLGSGTYKVTVKKSSKGNCWLSKYCTGFSYPGIACEFDNSSSLGLCSEGFIKVFGEELYNKITDKKQRYQVNFKLIEKR